MPCAFRIILRLFHRTKQHCAKYSLLFRPLNLFQQILQGARMNRIPPTLDMMAKIRSKRHKVLQFFRIWVLVNPKNKRNLQPVKVLRHRFIGCQHKLLNDLLSDGTLSFDNIDRFSILIYNNFGFHKVEINRPTLDSPLPQLERQLTHQAKVLHQVTITLN